MPVLREDEEPLESHVQFSGSGDGWDDEAGGSDTERDELRRKMETGSTVEQETLVHYRCIYLSCQFTTVDQREIAEHFIRYHIDEIIGQCKAFAMNCQRCGNAKVDAGGVCQNCRFHSVIGYGKLNPLSKEYVQRLLDTAGLLRSAHETLILNLYHSTTDLEAAMRAFYPQQQETGFSV
jgi:hypothetical protein